MRRNLQEIAGLTNERLPAFIAAAATMLAKGELKMELESICVCGEVMHTQAFGIGFTQLPITCPHCHKVHTSHDDMRFHIIVDEVKND